MTANLYLSPNTHTAITHLISRLEEVGHLTPVSILLPTLAAIQDLRDRLGDRLGVYLYQFYRLGNVVLDQAGMPIREISDIAVRRLIRCILGELNAEGLLTTFAAVWEKPGFLEVMLEWLREMKSQGIAPESYADYAHARGTEKDQQLAELYTRYQAFMQERHYSDADGLLWLTAEALEGDAQLFCWDGPLFVLGFDQFTPVQLRILGQLAGRYNELNIYLLWDEQRSEASLALNRLSRVRQQLLERIPLQVTQLHSDVHPNPLFAHLQRNLFDPGEAPPADQRYLQMVEAPSREAEVRYALRQVKRSLLAGVNPADIALLVPNQPAYLPILRAIATEYGVPVAYEQPLLSNPAVAALVNLLEVAPDYPWQNTFQALRSPYIRQPWLSGEQVELLDQLSRERPVVGGLEQWQFAVQPLQFATEYSDDEDFGPPPLVADLGAETLSGIERGLMAFFEHLTPPASATYHDYTWWLQTAILGVIPEAEQGQDQPVEPIPSLDLVGCCQEGPFTQRDMNALALVMRGLRRWLSSVESVPTQAEIAWEVYREELLALLGGMHIRPDMSVPAVRFGRMEAGRARLVDELYVLGLSEGEFPTPPPPDPLYTPMERETHPLPLMRFSPADDASLWWQLTGVVNRRLVLMRPYIDENGAEWQPSPYWEAVRDCFTDLPVERLRIADLPTPENAASLSELLASLAHSGASLIPLALRDAWAYSQHAVGVLEQRHSYNPPGEYEGVLQAEALRAELAERFGEDHVWSASRLSRYAKCPYGFFAEVVLDLGALPDPEEGLDAMQRGSLLHAILERLYRRLAKLGIAPTKANQETLLQHLGECCAAEFPSAPQRYGFRPGALWAYEQQELRRLLQALVAWECESNDPEARFLPYLQEAGFGIARDGTPALDIAADETCFRYHGVIDRVDRDAAGNLRVIDYKSGSITYSHPDIQKGLALQTALYALAAERFWAGDLGRVVESCYWLIPKRVASGKLEFQGRVRDNETSEAAIQRAAWSVARVRAGVFPSAPAEPGQGDMRCSNRCDFAPLCRVSRQSVSKARRGGWA